MQSVAVIEAAVFQDRKAVTPAHQTGFHLVSDCQTSAPASPLATSPTVSRPHRIIVPNCKLAQARPRELRWVEHLEFRCVLQEPSVPCQRLSMAAPLTDAACPQPPRNVTVSATAQSKSRWRPFACCSRSEYHGRILATGLCTSIAIVASFDLRRIGAVTTMAEEG